MRHEQRASRCASMGLVCTIILCTLTFLQKAPVLGGSLFSLRLFCLSTRHVALVCCYNQDVLSVGSIGHGSVMNFSGPSSTPSSPPPARGVHGGAVRSHM